MANTKLDRIERNIEKTRAKILEYQKRLKDLEAQKIEEENAQIVQMVKAVHPVSYTHLCITRSTLLSACSFP